FRPRVSSNVRRQSVRRSLRTDNATPMIIVAFAALLAGLIGALTGIGGVILVPALTEGMGTPVDSAIGTVMFALVFSAPVPAYSASRDADFGPVLVGWLCATAALGAVIGTMTLGWFPARTLRLLVASAALVSGLHALLSRELSKRSPALGN